MVASSPGRRPIPHCPFIVLTPGISAQFVEPELAVQPPETGAFAGISANPSDPDLLLAMQKVVGSNPISRFAKGLQNEVFPRPPSSPELLSPDDCLRIGRAPAGTPDLKLGDLQANSAPVEPSSFCGPRRRPLVLTALVASQSRGISSCPSGPGRALAGAMATPVVLSRHVQTLAFIGFRHTARRWSGLPVIVPERAPGRDGGGARIRGRACAVSCKGILSGPV
jgi:hypothetical protein